MAVWLARHLQPGRRCVEGGAGHDQKAQNLAGNSHCSMTVSSTAVPALDLVVEGQEERVTDDATLQRVAAAYGATLHWPVTVQAGALDGQNAPTAGPAPYAVFALTPTTVLGLPGVAGMDEQGQDSQAPFVP